MDKYEDWKVRVSPPCETCILAAKSCRRLGVSKKTRLSFRCGMSEV